jgi:hypothetical protein
MIYDVLMRLMPAQLALRKPPPCCGVRYLQISGHTLTFRWNEIQGSENYEHDLLRTVVWSQRGKPIGADALVAALRLGVQQPWFRDALLSPVLHQRIIGVLESATWRKLSDPRLMRITAEAYETWWSLSLSKPTDFAVADMGFTASNFSEGAEEARLKAIQLYEHILATQDNPELRTRVANLRASRDTGQLAWFRSGD